MFTHTSWPEDSCLSPRHHSNITDSRQPSSFISFLPFVLHSLSPYRIPALHWSSPVSPHASICHVADVPILISHDASPHFSGLSPLAVCAPCLSPQGPPGPKGAKGSSVSGIALTSPWARSWRGYRLWAENLPGSPSPLPLRAGG